MTPLRIVLADDSVLFRRALAELLRGNDCEVVAHAGDEAGLLAEVAARRPDLAVVDIRMPPTHRLGGLHAAVRIRRDHPEVGVLLLSHHLETAHLMELAGHAPAGVGYLLKDRASEVDFLDAVRRIAAGGCAFDPEVVATMFNAARRGDPVRDLSAREHDVLSLMAEGLSNAAIAEKLRLTVKTVETHIHRIFQRLGLPAEAEHHRRVLAVLAYLRSTEHGYQG